MKEFLRKKVDFERNQQTTKMHAELARMQRVNIFQITSTIATNSITNHSVSPLPEPIGKGRSSSTSSSITSNDSGSYYQRAPGSEREDLQVGLTVSIIHFSRLQLTLNAPIATKVFCSRLLKCLRCLRQTLWTQIRLLL